MNQKPNVNRKDSKIKQVYTLFQDFPKELETDILQMFSETKRKQKGF